MAEIPQSTLAKTAEPTQDILSLLPTDCIKERSGMEYSRRFKDDLLELSDEDQFLILSKLREASIEGMFWRPLRTKRLWHGMNIGGARKGDFYSRASRTIRFAWKRINGGHRRRILFIGIWIKKDTGLNN